MQGITEAPVPNVNAAAAVGRPEELLNAAQDSVSSRSAARYRSFVLFLVVLVLSLVWFGHFLHRGWVAHDDGMLAQSAERVLQGQLPHRDFDEVYTGGLSYLNAAAFRLFGMNLMSLRFMLYIFFAVWVAALFYCASKLASPLAAALLTLLGVAWSTPNYPAAMPSWYNLFFATFGLAAALQFIESRKRVYLLLAGACGGLSFLVKSPGLYFIIAILLFVVFCEQSDSFSKASPATADLQSPRAPFRLLVTASAACLVIALTFFIRKLVDLSELYNFVLPGAILTAVLVSRESKIPALVFSERLRRLLGLAMPVLAGAALPILVFLTPYALSHSLGAFDRGVFVWPFKRVAMAKFSPPDILNVGAVGLPVALCAAAIYTKLRDSITFVVSAAAGLGILLWVSAFNLKGYRLAWMSVATIIPVIVGVGAALIIRENKNCEIADARKRQIFLVISVIGFCSLIQFPYSSPTYFCYVSPLVAIAALALITAKKPAPRVMPAVLAFFYAAFAMFRVTPGFRLDTMSSGYLPAQPTAELVLARAGGLRISPDDARTYERLNSMLQGKSLGHTIYAGPDCPEVYFLGGFQNPTRMIFDAFEDYSQESSRVLSAIDAARPNVIVINFLPLVSTPLSGDLRGELEIRYPHATDIGKFQVRWRQ